MFHKTKRAWTIVASVLEYLVFYNINKHKDKFLGQRLRELFEKLGVTFIKIGQILSTRYDLLDERDCIELQKLLDSTKPLSYALIRELVNYELKEYPENLFASFEKKPLASASMSQVHRATLKTGEQVVVKIRRPKIERIIHLDIIIFKRISIIAMIFSGKLRHMRVDIILSQMHDWLLQETDFVREQKNIMTIYREYDFCSNKRFRKDLGVGRFIYIHPDFCSKNIITTNYIDGVPLSKKNLIEKNPEYNIYKSIKTYVSAPARRMFMDKAYYFQGDPHPGNVLILKDGGVSNIDCGLIGYFSRQEIRKVHDLILAIYSRDVHNVIMNLLDICNAEPKKYFKRLYPDMKRYVEESSIEGLGFWFLQLIKILTKHRVPFPQNLVLFGRMNVVLDGLVHIADPDVTTAEIIGEELDRAIRKKIVQNVKDADYDKLLYKISERINKSPEHVANIIDRYYDHPETIIRDIRKIRDALM